LKDKNIHGRLTENCERARQALNWQSEEKKLLEFYKGLFAK
jgi:hypothetical protein